MSVFGENNSRCLSKLLQSHIFWNVDHISGTYNQINCRNIWFAKVIILILTAQMPSFDVFYEKDHIMLLSFIFQGCSSVSQSTSMGLCAEYVKVKQWRNQKDIKCSPIYKPVNCLVSIWGIHWLTLTSKNKHKLPHVRWNYG